MDRSAAKPQPLPPDAVRQQLARVLASPGFAHAPILRRFLQHVVEHRLRGDGSSLKEYVLGVEVFDRGEAFDPRTDTIVRVHARRLRERLTTFYARDGRGDPIVIEVPKGQYQACVRTTGADVAADTLPAAHERDWIGPPLAAPANAGRLPAPRTPLLGRASELAELVALLRDGGARLLTVTGAGGSGKTRLALQAGWELRAAFAGGVRFVALAAVQDEAALLVVLARTFGVRGGSGQSLADALVGHLQAGLREPTLLLLDNFEQLAAAAPRVGELLDACATLSLLVTSRAPLHLYGEHDYPLAPLELPAVDPLPSLPLLADNAAVKLFQQRATAVRPGFVLDDDNALAIARICRGLDGLPLAIELAAAQAAKLSPQQMLERFADHLDLPANPARDVPARQRTLRRTLDWSHELLNPVERAVFRRLSVFAGGFDAEGAEAVANTDLDIDADTAIVIEALADKHLLQRVVHDGEALRYLLLETVRAYGREQLDASGEALRVQRSHAAYCLVLTEEANHLLQPESREAWLRRCDREHDNLRAALDGLLQRGEADWALRMAVALHPYWELRDQFVEGHRYLAASVELADADADPAPYAKALLGLGLVDELLGDGSAARARFKQALAVYRAHGPLSGVAAALNSLAVSATFHGDYPAAQTYARECLQACRRHGGTLEIAAALSNLANVQLQTGDTAAARASLQEARALFADLGDELGVAWCHNHLGDVAAHDSDAGRARVCYREGERDFSRLGDGWGLGRSCIDLGDVALQCGELDEAGRRYVQALQLFRQIGHRRGIAIVLDSCAELAVHRQLHGEALQLAGAADAIRVARAIRARPQQRARLQQALAPAWQALPAARARQQWDAGAKLEPEQVIELAWATAAPAGAA